MSAIIGYVTEVDSLELEIKRLNGVLRGLRKQKVTAEAHIANYFKSNGLPGGKLRGKEIRLVSKNTRARKSMKAKESDAMNVLREEGIRDPERLLERLLDAQKGDEVESYKVSIRKM